MFEGIAQLLGTIDGLTYAENEGSNVFLNRMASAPDNAVAVYPRPSSEPDSKLPYDPVEFQVVVRGEPDAVWAMAIGRAIYSKLHGLRNTTLPDGTYCVFVVAQSSMPFPIGDDENGRPQFSWEYRGEQTNITEARPE